MAGKQQRRDSSGKRRLLSAPPRSASKRRTSARPAQCFVVSPIGKNGSEIRRHANCVLRRIVRPAFKGFGYIPKRIDQSGESGSITQGIIRRIHGSRLCIAILTKLNPNVMYEVGVRHAWDLAIIPLAEEGTELPFDLQDYHTIFYSLESEKSVKRAIRDLAARVRHIERKLTADPRRGPPQMLPAFSEVMGALGRRYLLDALFPAKGNAIRTLADCLRRIRREIERDFESGNAKVQPLKCHAKVLSDEFDRLADKVEVFDDIVRDSNHHESPRGHCDGILERMKTLQTDGWRLCKKWKEATGTEKEFREAIREVGSLISVCQAIVEQTK